MKTTSKLQCSCEPDHSARRTRREALMLLAAVGVPTEAVMAQDAAKVEPRSYRVLFENHKVRLVEYTARPGLGVCGTGRHSHPDHVTVVLTPAKVRVAQDDGTFVVNDVKAGSAFWEPAATHAAENVGGSGTRMLLIEIKDKDWKPATG